MSCITAIATRIGQAPAAVTGRITGPPVVTSGRMGRAMSLSAERDGRILDVSTSRIGNRLSVTCTLICSVKTHYFLQVSPNVMWLADNEGLFDVRSNTDWTTE